MDKDFEALLDRMTSAGFDVKNMNRRDFISVAAAMVGTITLASCGGSSGGSGSGSGTTLNQWYHQYGEAGTQQAVLRYAKQYTQANVKVSWLPGDYGSKLSASLLTPTGPDVYELGSPPTIAMQKAGQIVALDDLYTSEVKSDYPAAILDSLTINGHIYGVKMLNDIGLLYYRKSMLSAKGVAPPANMDELISGAKKLTSRNVKGLFIGNDGGIGSLLNLLPWSAGADFLVNNQIVFDTPRTALAYQKLRELNQTNALLLGSPTDWYDPSAFTQGLTAMQYTGLWAMPAIQKALGDDFGIMAWPPLDSEGTPAIGLGGWVQLINGHSKYVDQAKAFVKWLWIDNTTDQMDFNQSYGFHIPARKSLVAKATKLQSGPAAEAVQLFNQHTKILPPAWDTAMSTDLTTAVSNIVKNGAAATAQVHTAAQQCAAELKTLLGS